ncbi:MAG: hypothetical protein NXI22_25735 [bacterium]|nr:hypothetical protein [bacterium]
MYGYQPTDDNNLKIEDCEAAQIWFQPKADGMLTSIIVWRDEPTIVKLPPGRRVSTLERGDVVSVGEDARIVDKVEAYR